MVDYLLGLIDAWGYPGIFVLMTIESTIIPFPTELIIPPAGYLAMQGKMTIGAIVFSAVAGTVMGAVLNYFLAYYWGRKFLFSFTRGNLAKWFFLSEEKLLVAEAFFLKYGAFSTFLGRMVPGVRSFISLPAGFSKMPLGEFVLFTALGSFGWIWVLALLGFYFGESKELLKLYYKEASLVFLLFAALILILRFLLRKR